MASPSTLVVFLIFGISIVYGVLTMLHWTYSSFEEVLPIGIKELLIHLSNMPHEIYLKFRIFCYLLVEFIHFVTTDVGFHLQYVLEQSNIILREG